MRSVLSPTPLDLVNFLFYFQGFQVIEFGLVRLKFCMEFVFASFLLPMVSCSERNRKWPEDPLRLESDGPIRSSQRVLPVRPCHQLLDNCQCGRILQLILCPLL